MRQMGIAVLMLVSAAFVACSGSTGAAGCTNCAKLVACCNAEFDGGAPTGGRCTNNMGAVTSAQGENSSCESDPGFVQGDADSTCKGYVTTEAALPGAPAACQ